MPCYCVGGGGGGGGGGKSCVGRVCFLLPKNIRAATIATMIMPMMISSVGVPDDCVTGGVCPFGGGV